MSGELVKHRVIISGRLVSPISCCRDFNKKALSFKHSVNLSSSQSRLQADVVVKALGADFSRKQNEENTDNKKREFTGDSMPGVEKNDRGYRWRPNAKYEAGAELVLSPSYLSRYGMDTKPNFGWLKPEEVKKETLEETLNRIRTQPTIQVSKFTVDPRTDDIDPSSQKIVDPFALAAGMTMEERRARLNKEKGIQEKALGRTLGQRVPGGSLIARAAAAIGILRDENNKFRCPPGTPAANQFTDATGSNCFGFSASRFARYAAERAAELTDSGEMKGFRNATRAVLDFLYTGRMFKKDAERDPARAGRSPWYDAVTGERIDSPDWRDFDGPENLRLTSNGMAQAQDIIQRDAADIADLMSALNVDTSDARRETNEDLAEAFQTLRDNGIWDVQLVGAGGSGQGRLSPRQVEEFIKARLEHVPGWNGLSQEERDVLIKADIKRYYETERAFLESILTKFISDPATTKFLGVIEFNMGSDDESNFAVIKTQSQVVEVTDAFGRVRKQRIPGELRGKIGLNMEIMMENQENGLPGLSPGERLSLAVVGAGSTPQAQSALAHFMLNSGYAARNMAGLVDGPNSSTRHVGFHEYSHMLQALSFIQEVERRIAAGTFEIAQYDRNGNYVGTKQIGSIDELSSGDIMNLMMDAADGINVEELGQVLTRLDGIAQFAGTYPSEYGQGSELWALEACAELYALREQGLISGDDVDSVLEWMDNVSVRNAATNRVMATNNPNVPPPAGPPTPGGPTPPGTPPSPPGVPPSPNIPGQPGGQPPAPQGPNAPSTSPVPGVADDLTPEELAAEVEAARRRSMVQRQKQLDKFKEEFPWLEHDEMLEVGAELATQIDDLEEGLQQMEQLLGADSPELMPIRDEVELLKAMYKEANAIWGKKYVFSGTKKEKTQQFDKKIYDIRLDSGTLSGPEMRRIAREKQLNDIREDVDTMSDADIVRKLADKQILMKNADLSGDEDELIKQAEEFDLIKDLYIDKLRAGGDKRTRTKISNEIDENIETLTKPKPKPAKKFKSKTDSEDYVKNRRVVQSRKLSKEQREALKQTANVEDLDINKTLDPATSADGAKAIRKRNERLKRLGLQVDETSVDEAPIEKQVENVIIPLMEAMDESKIFESVDIEATIEIDPKKVTGRSVGKEIDIETFVSGELMPRGKRKPPLTRQEAADAPEGKKKVRVVVSVKDGDRGLYTARDKDGEYRLMLPPGSFRVTSRDEDGTIRIEVSSQKNTEEVLDSMRDAVDRGIPDDRQRKIVTNKISPVIDNYITKRRESGDRVTAARTKDDSEIADVSSAVVSDAIDAGATIGEGPDSPLEGELPAVPTPAPEVLPTRVPGPDRGEYVYVDRPRSAIRDRLVGGRYQIPMSSSEIDDRIENIKQRVNGTVAYGEGLPMDEARRVIDELVGPDVEVTDLSYEELDLVIGELSARAKDAKERAARAKGYTQQDLKNKSIALGYQSSAIHDLKDLIYARENGYVYPTPYQKWDIEIAPARSYRTRDTGGGRLSSGARNGKSVYGARYTRTQGAKTRREMVSSHVGELRKILSGKASDKFPEMSRESIDPRVAELIKTLPPEEIYQRIEQTAYKLHAGLDRRVRVRMREAEVEDLLARGLIRSPMSAVRQGEEMTRRARRRADGAAARGSDYSRSLSSGKVNKQSIKKGITQRLANMAFDRVVEGMDLDEEETEVLELIVNTALDMKKGPQVALTKLGIELGKRGSRELADFVVQRLLEDGRIDEGQARAIISRLDRVLPDDLPDPIMNAAAAGARAARGIIDTPGTRRRASAVADAVTDRVDSAREAVTERGREAANAGARRLRALRDRARRPEPINNLGESGPPIVADLPDFRAYRGRPPAKLSSGRVSLSSGRTSNVRPVEKNLKPGSISPDTKTISGVDDRKVFAYEVTVYNIGGQNVAFGAPPGVNFEDDVSDIELIPLNPYVISGLDSTSQEGRDTAMRWIKASFGRNSDDASDDKSYVSALLYAASRGDTDAQREFDDLVEKGEEIISKSTADRKAALEETIQKRKAARAKKLEEIKQNPNLSEEQKEALARPNRANGYSGLSVDDLYLVHETTHPVQYDDDGNIILRPNGDYPMVDENGAPLLDPEGRPWDTYRGTLHFTLNHRVSGHDNRESPKGSTVIMVPLRAVLEANPDSLDNLFGVDSYLTPPPGEPLRLPGAKTVSLDKDEADPFRKVHEALIEMGMNPDVALYGDSESVGVYADDQITGIAAELGVNSGMHFDTLLHHAETMRRHQANSFPVSPGRFANLSPAALLRLLDTDRWVAARRSGYDNSGFQGVA